MNRTTRIKITELNPHVICVLCGGYFINATTIVECLHSFCRTCITRYLETSKYCPVCDVMVHKTRPLEYIRSDKTLQDLVYKLVPCLYKNEMKRRREYYCEHDPPGVSPPASEDRGDEFHDRIIYTEDEKISLSLELCAEGIPFKTPSAIHGHSGPENIKIKDVRYLRCPAAFSVGNLKKFIRMKFDLKMKYEIDIFHTAEPLPDYYTLMDIAYIYTWTRRAPVRLFYTVFERKLTPKAISEELKNITKNVVSSENTKVDEDVKKIVEALPDTKPPLKAKKDKLENKKRKLLEGPDDISPDLDLEKSRANHKKENVPRKRAKKHLVVDNSVMEAMSESEEQFAKLTLNSSIDESGSKVSVTCNQDRDVNGADKMSDNVTVDSKDVTGAKEDVSVDCVKSDSVADNVISATDTKCGDLKVDTGDVVSASEHVSPGSISLSLFQPLNHANAEKKDSDKLYEFTCEQTTVALPTLSKPKAKRGRKTKSEKKKDASEASKETSDANSIVSENPNPSLPPSKKVSKKDKSKDPKVPSGDKVTKKPKDNLIKSNKTSDTQNGADVPKVKRKYVRKAKPGQSSDKKGTVTGVNNQSNDTLVDGNNCDKDISVTQSHEIVTCKEKTVLESEQTIQCGKEETRKCDTHESETEPDNSAKGSTNSTDGKQTVSDGKPEVPQKTGQIPEPNTPLYGKTPKVCEFSEGVPVSPVPECAEKGASVTGNDAGAGALDEIGANRGHPGNHSNEAPVASVTPGLKAASDGVAVKCSTSETVKSNAAVSIAKRPILPHPVYKPMTGNQLINTNGFIRGLVPGSVAFSTYGSNLVNMAPVSVGCLLGNFPQMNTASGHMINGMPGHMTGSYSLMEPSSDQPLDLTNNGHRDEYMKGKIFKTKMLKKTYTRTDSVTNAVPSIKDKQAGMPGCGGMNGNAWT